ncbi:N-methyl-L-tryptophan oxidase [Alkalibacillus salilacus]|uniref:Sarcosine oxidase/N-methyl-L-tryptophan oxidase n=1 Tax=Alkalibacillus salilacus TaxID=284582 RepID=A0ABT9VGP0_9BACI|nr:N-methyl-L-tryptophan oxidase [Alkalibacillus salilacus]MDQ0160121.1 sarcosine oxidase/N-methyl-L-tryptophan oxidase [Alkalibacillus salilacus]
MYDVAIIGAGSMGLAAGYYLAKSGKNVLLVDSDNPPHDQGSHHGETRLIRQAYGEGSSYVPLAIRALTLWKELDLKTEDKLFYETGVLNIGDKNSEFIQQVRRSAAQFGLGLTEYSATEVNNKWQGFKLGKDLVGCFESESGVLMSERCLQTYRDLALNHGAELKSYAVVQNIVPKSDYVQIMLNDGKIDAQQVIISAGKHTNQFLEMLNEHAPLTPTRKTFSWFQANEAFYGEDYFPGWAYDVNQQTFYGFPSIENQGIKLGRHDGGQVVKRHEPLDSFGEHTSDINDVQNQVERLFSESMVHKEGQVCTYTNTPDGDFIIDQVPGYSHIHVACGFSGHGFKFSSVVGEILTEFIIDGESKFDLTPFRYERFRN